MVGFGTSNVPLIKSIRLDKDREFIPTLSEWQAKKGNQVIEFIDASYQTGTAASTYYEIPKGRVLFISSMYLNVINTDAAVATTIYFDLYDAIENVMTYVQLLAKPNDIGVLNLSFPMPLKIVGGENYRLKVTTDETADCIITAGFYGWIEDKELF